MWKTATCLLMLLRHAGLHKHMWCRIYYIRLVNRVVLECRVGSLWNRQTKTITVCFCNTKNCVMYPRKSDKFSVAIASKAHTAAKPRYIYYDAYSVFPRSVNYCNWKKWKTTMLGGIKPIIGPFVSYADSSVTWRYSEKKKWKTANVILLWRHAELCLVWCHVHVGFKSRLLGDSVRFQVEN